MFKKKRNFWILVLNFHRSYFNSFCLTSRCTGTARFHFGKGFCGFRMITLRIGTRNRIATLSNLTTLVIVNTDTDFY